MSAEPGGHTSCYYLRQRSTYMFLPVFVCLSVSKIAQKRVHGFVLNVACRQMSDMDELINLIRIIVRMLEPDCFLRYRISAATRNFIMSGTSHRPTYTYWPPVAAVRCGFKMVLFTASRRNIFVGGSCALPSALLVYDVSYCSLTERIIISQLRDVNWQHRVWVCYV